MRRVLRTELREDAYLHSSPIVNLGSIEPGEYEIGGADPREVGCIDPSGIQPLKLNKLLVRYEDFDSRSAKASGNPAQLTTLPLIKKGSGEVDLHARSIADLRPQRLRPCNVD